jgi:HEAT repeat protein
MLRRATVLVALATAIALPLGYAQDEFKDEIRKLLNDGIDLYKRGKYAEAHAKFEEALQKKPDSDLVYAFIKRAGEDLVASMMSSPDAQMKADGYRLFELAKPGEIIRRDKKAVLKYIEDLKSDDFAVVENARWHLKNFGPWALRFLVMHLGHDLEDKFRSRVILTLTEMGTDATLGVIECLDNTSDETGHFMRQNASIVLGNIKDERALPALRRVSENPNEKPEVKKFALEACLKITRKTQEQLKGSKDYYFELAEKYYRGHSSVMHAWNRAHLIFRWDPEKHVITEREVPRFAFNEQLAEEALYDLLKLDANYLHPDRRISAWTLLAAVHYAQNIEAEIGIRAAEDALKNGEPGLKPSEVDDLKKWLANHNRHNVLASVPGKRTIYDCLAYSIKHNDTLVAKACIETIKEMGRPEDLPPVAIAAPTPTDTGTPAPAVDTSSYMGYPLIQALTNDDKRVRYAASEAMVKINPQTRRLGMELVVPNLIDAVGEQGVRVALVIYEVQDDADRNFVNQMKKLLTKVNVFPVFATSGEEGIIKGKQFPSEDVIFIQKKIAGRIYFKETEIKKPVVETVFDTLRDDVRTKWIPRVLLCDNAAEAEDAKKQYLETGTGQGVVTKDECTAAGSHLMMQGMLDKLFDSPEAKKDSKDRADMIAKSAAETFASIDVTNTLYPFRDAVDALIKTVSPEILREDFIRIPAARSLGHFGDQRAVDVLVKVLNDKAAGEEDIKRQKGVRWACSRALSEIFKVVDHAPSKENYEILKKNLLDGDYDIELSVGEAMGNSKLSNEQRLDLNEHRRVNNRRETRTPEDD